MCSDPSASQPQWQLHTDWTDAEQNILAYDLGGGTFDVSLLTMTMVSLDCCNNGGTQLGGEDLTTRHAALHQDL